MVFSKTQQSNSSRSENVASRTQQDVDMPSDAVVSAASPALPQDDHSDASHENGSDLCDESGGFVNDSSVGENDGSQRAAELSAASAENDSVQGMATNALSHGYISTHEKPETMCAASHITGGSARLERDTGGDSRSQTKTMRGNPVTMTLSNSRDGTEYSAYIEESTVNQGSWAKTKRRGCLSGLDVFLAKLWEKSPQVMRTFIKFLFQIKRTPKKDSAKRRGYLCGLAMSWFWMRVPQEMRDFIRKLFRVKKTPKKDGAALHSYSAADNKVFIREGLDCYVVHVKVIKIDQLGVRLGIAYQFFVSQVSCPA